MTVALSAPPLVLRSLDSDWDYTRWEALPADGYRYEIIAGVLYMTTAPSFFHQWIIQRLIRLVGIPAEDQGTALFALAPVGLLMPGCDPVPPDFLLVRRERAAMIRERRIRGVPDLMVEVLSPANHEQDTVIKRGAYARAGVPEYWIIGPANRDVLICWQPDSAFGAYVQTQLYGTEDHVSSPTLPITLSVAALFLGSPDETL